MTAAREDATERARLIAQMTAETIGERLKRLRLAAGLSQRQLADPEQNLSYAYISRLEAGQRQPSLRAVRVLAHRLGVNPVYLETGALGECPHCGQAFPAVTESVRLAWLLQ